MIRKATAILLAVTLLVGAIIIDGVFARIYFYANRVRLENAADAAVIAGSMYLPDNPEMALKTALRYASLNGVSADEIVGASVSPDKSSISITLRRTIPFYLSSAGIGQPNEPVVAKEKANAAPPYRGAIPSANAPQRHSFEL